MIYLSNQTSHDRKKDWQEEEEKDVRLLHTIGNLVLTSDNSSYGNLDYSEKRGDTNRGVSYQSSSALAQEREIASKYPIWTPEQCHQRNKELGAWIIERWSSDEKNTQTDYDYDESQDEEDI